MTSLADEIADVVRSLGGSVTHGTLINRLGKGRMCGDSCIEVGGNVVVFVNASDEFYEAVKNLREERPPRIVLRPIEYICLCIDGSPVPIGMPTARRPPKNGYQKPHFAAVCFDVPDNA